MLQKPEPVTLLADDDSRAQSFDLDVDGVDEEMSQLTISMGEDETELNESNDNLSQLEELAGGLESIHNQLSDCANGADPITLKFARHAQKALTARHDLPMGDYSVESIGNQVTRKEATEMALESIADSLKNAYKKFMEFMRRMWEAFERFVESVFRFFLSTRKRLVRLKAIAQKLKASGAASRVEELKLPKRLQSAFMLKNKPIDPLELVADGKFVARIEEFGSSHIKYTSLALSELSNFLQSIEALKGRLTSRVTPPTRLMGLLDAEKLIRTGFGGSGEAVKGRFVAHVDIPGNQVMELSAPLNHQATDADDFRRMLGGLKVKVHDYEIKGTPQLTIPQLSLDDVVTICDQGIACLKVADTYHNETKRLSNERAKILRSVEVLYDSKYLQVDLSQTVVSSIAISISHFTRNALNAGGTFIGLMRKAVVNATDVAYLATRQYGSMKDEAGELQSGTVYHAEIVEPLRLTAR